MTTQGGSGGGHQHLAGGSEGGHQHRGGHGGSGGQGSPEDWDRRYGEAQWPSQPDPLLVNLASALPPGNAIDLGSGPGRNGLWLASRGWEVTLVDGSTVGLAQADQRAKEAGTPITTLQGDLAEYTPQAGRYDLVIVANIHLHPPQRAHLFAGAADALAPGGHLFVVGHHAESLGTVGPPDPQRLYDEEMLAQAFPTLRILELGRTKEGETGEHRGFHNVYLWATRPS